MTTAPYAKLLRHAWWAVWYAALVTEALGVFILWWLGMTPAEFWGFS